MDSDQDKTRKNVEVDRLSSLPDDLIHKILSIIGLKRAIQMTALSSRWRFLWTSLPCLDFSVQDFPTFPKFSQFVLNVLSRRNNLVEVFSIKLRFCGDFSLDFVKQLMNYAFSHNIQQLNVVCLLEKNIEFPLSLFTSRSLKHLSLTRENGHSADIYAMLTMLAYSITVTSTLDLPALTTLYLYRITLCNDNDENTDKYVDFFSKCANLKNLTLESCKMKGLYCFRICNPLLCNLTLASIEGSVEFFNVVAPKLKNLNIRSLHDRHYLISTPELATLFYRGYRRFNLASTGLNSMEKVDLCISKPDYSDGLGIVYLFEQLKSVKFLKFNLEIVELLSSYTELISDRPSPFANLKSVNIYPERELSEYSAPEKVNMATEVKNYLLDNSPNATFTMITREEIRDMKNMELAQNEMADFRKWLEREKSKIDTNMAFMEEERKKAPMESHNTKRHKHKKKRFKYLLELEEELWQGDQRIMDNAERITEVNECWKYLNRQIKEGNEKTCDIISQLHDIKEILMKLPTSTRDEMQECFSRLCAEADFVVNKILDRVKIHCDTKRSVFGVHFKDIASTSQPSS